MALDLIQRLFASPQVIVPQADDLDTPIKYREKQTNRGYDNDFVINVNGDIPDPVSDIDVTILANHELAAINFHLSFRVNGVVLKDQIFAGPFAFGGGQDCPVANALPPDQISFVIPAGVFRAAIDNNLPAQTIEVHFNNINNFDTACGGQNDIELNIDYIGNNRNPGDGPSYMEWVIFNDSMVNGGGHLTRGRVIDFAFDYVRAAHVGLSKDELRKLTIAGFTASIFKDTRGQEVGCLVMQSTGEVGGVITSFIANGTCSEI